ncbi:MAG: DUF6488 family protein [Pseudomonadales bacterium]|nr:DUF6488 family protein [Pseudomonadales bacterium]
MKNLLNVTALIAGLVLSTGLWAHPGHDEVVQLTQETAIEAAEVKLAELIDTGELTSGWAEREPAGAQVARINGRQNWIVSYQDESARERLELVFSMTGEYLSMSKTALNSTASN